MLSHVTGRDATHGIKCLKILSNLALNTSKNIVVTREKNIIQTTVNIPLRKKKKKQNHSPKLTVITIGKYKEGKLQERAGNGDAHTILGSFNGQIWKCKQVATHLCLKVKWAGTAKFSSRKHGVTYVYLEYLTPCE